MLAEDDDQRERLLGESIGHAIVDSGCCKTVCGDLWLNTYLESLSQKDRKSIYSEKTISDFRFGVGKIYRSTRLVHVPVHIGSFSATLAMHVVPCDVPLLMSRMSLKKAGAILDFQRDSLHIFGESIPLVITESGHYCLPLSRPLDQPHSPQIQKVLFSSPVSQLEDKDERTKKITKLHKQFAHPHPDRLKALVRNAGTDDKCVLDTIDEVSANCDVCKRYKRSPPRPAVGFPLATTFNDTVAMDLKTYSNGYMFHMIDHATRYSQACFIRNKQSGTIVKAVLKYWIGIFGTPVRFLSDNGGEFVNAEFNELAEKFNIKVLTTAAESPWSNGLCEKHNGILGDMIQKSMDDGVKDLELAIHWSTAAKNSLMNVYGFSPNQLVFGRNPNHPAVYSDLPPAQRQSTVSENILQTLQALHTARLSFIKQESCERLRRALSRQTRSLSNFLNGDYVYYKRNDSSEWHGPARVLGKDSQQYLLKHGGVYIRVHPCRMQLASEETEFIEPAIAASGPTPQQAPVQEEHPSEVCEEEEDEEPQEPELFRPPTPPDTPAQPVLIPASPNPALEVEVSPVPERAPIGDGQKPESSAELSPQDDQRLPAALKRLLDFNTSPVRPEHQVESRHEDDSEPEEDVYFCGGGVRFGTAKLEEIQKWRDMDVIDEVPDTGQPRISCRWVCTEKMKGGVLVLKARLCVRGCEEVNEQAKTDSPTCQKESLRLLLCLLASHNWTLHSMDIKSAYLQGMPLDRLLYVQPPKEANTNNLWRLKKCAYGLSDAGRHWYLKVVEELKSLGAEQLSLDQAVFVWHDAKGQCIGIMATHVDDFIYGGTVPFLDTVIPRLRSVFKIGLEESSGMKYVGILIGQSSTGISLSTTAYSESLREIADVGGDKDRRLEEHETKALRRLSGQLNWISCQSRPDVAFDNCAIGNAISKATVRDVTKANKAVRKARAKVVTLHYAAGFDLMSCRIVCYTDASFGNLPDGGSQGAYIIFLCDPGDRSVPITWQSRRIRRAVNSTLAAECMAAVEGAEACFHLKALIQEILSSSSPCESFPISIMCDNRSLVDAVHSSTAVQNKRLQIEVGILRDMLQKSELEEFRWIPTTSQVANALTKAGTSVEYLLQILRGRLCFKAESGQFE